jgi:hypothetical protein
MTTQAVRAPEYGSMGGEYGMYQGGFPGAAMGMVSHSLLYTSVLHTLVLARACSA